MANLIVQPSPIAVNQDRGSTLNLDNATPLTTGTAYTFVDNTLAANTVRAWIYATGAGTVIVVPFGGGGAVTFTLAAGGVTPIAVSAITGGTATGLLALT